MNIEENEAISKSRAPNWRAGFKNEENARQAVQEEMAAMREEIKNIKMGSSGIVSSEASTRVGPGSGTFARSPPLAPRWADPWVPRMLEFKV